MGEYVQRLYEDICVETVNVHYYNDNTISVGETVFVSHLSKPEDKTGTYAYKYGNHCRLTHPSSLILSPPEQFAR